MTSKTFRFPAFQAVEILDDRFGLPHEGCGLIAIVAPTFTPGINHVGIADVNGRDWKFIHGPARVQTSRIWKWLDGHSACFIPMNAIQEDSSAAWSSPVESLDDFIELITGRAKL